MVTRWKTKIGAFFAWLLICGLALVVIAYLATLYQLFIVFTLQVNPYTVQILVQSYYALMGLIWLGFLFLEEHVLFDRSIRQGLLLTRTLLLTGIEMSLVTAISLGTMAYHPIAIGQVAATAAEALLAVGLIWAARRTKPVKLHHSAAQTLQQ